MVQKKLSPEDLLLTWCSRVDMDEGTAQQIRDALGRGLDFDLLVRKSIDYDIFPLVYWHIRRIDDGSRVPPGTLEDLRGLYYSNSARRIILCSELSKILKAFAEAGIDAIVLKGAFLGEKVYGNPSLRPIGDLDLLVKRRDLFRVKGVMRTLGYRAPAFPTELHERLYQEQVIMETHYRKDGAEESVDIHWDIQAVSSPLQIDIEGFWSRALPVAISGDCALALSPEDNLLHLCLHLMEHANKGVTVPFKWYCDIVELIRHSEGMDWELLLERSSEFGVQEPVYRSLYTAKKHFFAGVPDYVLDHLSSGRPYAGMEYIIGDVKEGISGLETANADNALDWKKDLAWSGIDRLMSIQGYWNCARAEGSWTRARLLLGVVFPSREFMMQRYATESRAWVCLYYPVRLAIAIKLFATSLISPMLASTRARFRQG